MPSANGLGGQGVAKWRSARRRSPGARNAELPLGTERGEGCPTQHEPIQSCSGAGLTALQRVDNVTASDRSRSRVELVDDIGDDLDQLMLCRQYRLLGRTKLGVPVASDG